MCGIVGIISKKGDIANKLLNGLKKCSYRGYDSAGIATVYDNKIVLKKGIGKVEEVNKKLNFLEMKGNIGIAHTRWATHGKVTDKNAHPHLSNNKKIVVAHNGIIENYQELKKELINAGFSFYSETDTEVIPNLIQMYMDKGETFFDAVKLTVKRLEGSYAIVAINVDKNLMIGTRKNSPLVIGIGTHDNCFYFASDIPAFLDYTKKVVYLKNYDIALVNEKLEIFNLEENKFVKRKINTIEWDAEQAKKGEFKHFMIKEIMEQANIIDKAIKQDEKIIFDIAKKIKEAHGIYFVACGTAYHACVAGMYKFSRIAKKHVNVALASEFPNYVDFLTKESLVIAISQSGETADTLEAIRAAKKKGAQIISIVNVMGSSLVRESDQTLLQNAGPEICVLSTKSYTSQLAILTLLAYAIDNRYEEAKEKLKDLIKYIYYLTSETMQNYLKKLAENLKDVEHIYLIGRDLQYPTAMEAALKIKEVSYIHAEAYAGGELKHGPIALIENGTPCIVFTSEDTEKEIISNAMELKSRGAYLIGIGPKNNEIFDYFIKVREAEEANSICQIIPIQILAYQLALLRGYDPDKPRNLAKSVTVK